MATILVIEDDRTFLGLLRMHLLMVGYEVQTAEDPATGLRYVIDDPPDLILLDLDLPYMSGFDVLQALRADEKSKNIPVIVISGRDDAESYARCREFGVNGYFTKPVRSEQLIESIAAVAKATAKTPGGRTGTN